MELLSHRSQKVDAETYLRRPLPRLSDPLLDRGKDSEALFLENPLYRESESNHDFEIFHSIHRLVQESW